MNLRSRKQVPVKTGRFIYAYATLLIVLILLQFSVARAGQATDLLKGTLDKIIKVLKDPSLKAPGKEKERRETISKLLKERFDGKEFARKALGVHWKKRTEQEKQEFFVTFNNLLERTYFEKIDSYLTKAGSFSNKNIQYLDEKVSKRYTVVETQVIADKDTRVPVHYQMKNKKGDWLVCDLAIEGVSIVKNYRAQFNEILADSSFKALMTKLNSKQQTETKSQKKK